MSAEPEPDAPEAAADPESRPRPGQSVPGGAPPIATGYLTPTSKPDDTGPIGIRARFARFGRSATVPPVLEPVIRALQENHPRADTATLVRAYHVAEEKHRGQRRKSGDPYITHPVAVAAILAEIGAEVPVLVAALLHDTVEDTDYTVEELTNDFGAEIALLVDGVTKLDKVTYGEATQAETVRKMVLAMARDIRVLVIKLADRLHNARTWRYVSAQSASKKARETLEIYAPLAHRLGINAIKWELEDLSFATLKPGVYEEIVQMVADHAPSREVYMKQVSEFIQTDLQQARIKASVTARPKHYYSIYQKMVVRGREFSDIYDLVGVRVLVESSSDCYAVLGAVHARWNPVPGRFKDYIAMPKLNLYQSLHTTVIGPQGKPVEIQIRTHLMHQRAELGIAAHWKYKLRGGTSAQDITWLRQLADWQAEVKDPAQFLDELRYDVSAQQIFVFTPKGDVIPLPVDSTPVDFAYAVHTEVGHRTMGARVNGRLVALESKLENGDTVEIFTSKVADAGPSRDWLGFVASPRAKSKIRHWFSRERREEAIEAGKSALGKAMRKQQLPIQRLLTHDTVSNLARELRYADVSALYAAVGENHISAQSVIDKLVTSVGGLDGAEETIAEAFVPTKPRRPSRNADAGVVVKGVDDVWVKLAKCCTPVPGDDILGFITRGAGVSVHRTDCTNAASLRQQASRLVEVEWAVSQNSIFLVQVQVEAVDRSGLLSDITRALSDSHVNILSASVSTSRDRVALSRFVFEMGSPQHLQLVLAAVRKVPGVFDVYRTTDTSPDKPQR